MRSFWKFVCRWFGHSWHPVRVAGGIPLDAVECLRCGAIKDLPHNSTPPRRDWYVPKERRTK